MATQRSGFSQPRQLIYNYLGAIVISIVNLGYKLLVRFFTDAEVSVADQFERLWIGTFIEAVIIGTVATFIRPEKWHPVVWISMASIAITFPWRRGIPIREIPGENLLAGIGLVITFALCAGIVRIVSQRIKETQQ